MNAVATQQTTHEDAIPQITSLAELKAASSTGLVSRGNRYGVHPSMLWIEPGFNIRHPNNPEVRAQIDAFKAQIRAHLTQEDLKKREQPLLFPDIVVRLRNGKLEVVEGHCRTTAAWELIAEGLDVPRLNVDVRTLSDRDARLLMYRSQNGLKLTPLERALGFRRMADEDGMSYPDIAKEIGDVTPQRVEQLMLLARAPQEVQDSVLRKEISADAAIEMIRKNKGDEAAVIAAVGAVVSRGAAVGAKTAGKGQTRLAMPRKAQEVFFDVLSSRGDEIKDKIAAAQKKAGDDEQARKEATVAVELPLELLEQVYALQEKFNSKKQDGAPAAESDVTE